MMPADTEPPAAVLAHSELKCRRTHSRVQPHTTGPQIHLNAANTTPPDTAYKLIQPRCRSHHGMETSHEWLFGCWRLVA